MKVSYRWLKRHVPDLPPSGQIAGALERMGWEVASQENWGQGFSTVELVEVLRRVKHPNADHLSIVSVRRGEDREIDVVTGAPNGFPGERVWYAPVGTKLIDGRTLDTVNMRGVMSPGMLLSASELGFSGSAEGLWIWKGDEAPGTSFLDVVGGSDVVWEVELTPNLAAFGQSMRAVALELAAAFDLVRPVALPDYPYGHGAMAQVADMGDCPLYGLVEYHISGPASSPLWLQVLLTTIGQRVISPAVDLTNFLLWDMGQPLHAFDADKVVGKIQVRRARDGEHLQTLDERDRILTSMDLVIADDQGPLALAGVMGGLRSAVDSETTHVYLESAHFDASLVFKTMRRHQIFSEAALRFGKGTDPEMAYCAPASYLALLESIGGLSAAGQSQMIGSRGESRTLPFAPDKIRALLGVQWDDKKILAGLIRLGFRQTQTGAIRIPPARHDVEGIADLAEEVARLYGIDSIPSTLFSSPAVPGQRSFSVAYDEMVKNVLAESGFWEIITRAFTSPERLMRAEMAVPEGIVHVSNPLREEERILRPALLPGLLETVEINRARRDSALQLFELASVYEEIDGAPCEHQEIAVVETLEEIQAFPRLPVPHVLHIKGVMEEVVRRCGLDVQWRQVENGPEYFHPGRTLMLQNRQGEIVGYLGELRPRLAQKYHAKRVAAWVMRLEQPFGTSTLSRISRPLRFSEVVRDLSLIIPASLSFGALLDEIRAIELPDLQSVQPIDAFEGEFGQSWTLRFIFQPSDTTLTVAQIDGRVAKIIEAVGSLGVVLRQ